MRRPLLKVALTLLSIGGLLTLGAAPAVADSPNGEIQQTVRVVGNGTGRLDRPPDHPVRFDPVRRVDDQSPEPERGWQHGVAVPAQPGGERGPVQERPGRRVQSDPATAAKGTRELVRDVHVMGLADVVPGWPEVVTENVDAGHLLPDGPRLTRPCAFPRR